MKKTASKVIAVAWLLVCLAPAWGGAEEPGETPAGVGNAQSTVVNDQQSWIVPLPSEAKATDEELRSIVGHGLDGLPPGVMLFPQKFDTAGSRIKLWDEGNRGVTRTFSLTGGGFTEKLALSIISSK
ncbi:hypothetical protein [Geobacter sp.]|uniref:hypothetical protein n=1 Tax=Geobacter sp. TaxID=46610 RepID=UPI00262C74DF|nr:hypothetical protein [Geobacter sp.]